MNDLMRFFFIEDPIIRNVLLGSVLVGISSSSVGCFTLLQRRSLIGDAIAHAVLPGIAVAFIFQGDKNPFGLICGAFCAGWISILLMDFIIEKTKLSQDTAIGIVLSFFFALGTVLLSVIQRMNLPNQAGLNNFLFGSVIGINNSDLIAFGILSILILITLILFYKELFILSFDPNYAKIIGLPITFLRLLLTTLNVLAVVAGIQAVGVVLMAAMLITPAAAARFWTNKLSTMIFLACILGVFSGFGGAFISYVTPSPTGPWIVLIMSFIASFSFLFSPQKGVVYNWLSRLSFKRKVLDENILKTFYHLGEALQDFKHPFSMNEIINRRFFEVKDLSIGINRLVRQGFLISEGQNWTLTNIGKIKGQRIVKLHRLWEVYLSEHLNLDSDHVHDDAESIEHILTPELESRLEKQLNYPKVDPHQAKIPYRN